MSDASFLTTPELAERWHVSIKTVQNWRSTGAGPPYRKLVGVVRYRLEDIVDFEANDVLPRPRKKRSASKQESDD